MFLDNIVNKAWNHLTSFGNRLLSNGRRAAYVGAATLILAAGAKLVKAETRYVDNDAKGLNNGTSWVNEYGYLEDELTIASIGNEEISFVARPDIGYVVKSEEKTSSISTLSRTLRLYGAEDIRPIGGLDRKGVSIVFSDYGASENQEIIEMLRANSRIKYAAPLFSVNGETIAIIPEIVARVTNETNSEQLQALCETIGLNIKKRMEYTKSEYLIEVLGNNANAVFAGVEQLNQLSYIEWAVPNIAFQLRFCGQPISDEPNRLEPNDTYFDRQWHLNTIHAPEAWWEITKGDPNIVVGDPNIVVAVLDTGVNYDHEDLIANIWRNPGEIPDNGIDDDENEFVDDVYGWDFKNNNPNPIDSDGHGTACAGLIAAQGNNGIGVVGVARNCRIMPIKIVQTLEDFATDDGIATAIRYAAENGADVLSNSWVYYPSRSIHSAIIDVTVRGREGKGCVVFAGAGNLVTGIIRGIRPVLFPARYPEVIAVGATDLNDMVWYYSCRGPELDIVAPSGNVDMKGNLWTTDITGSAGYNNRDPNILDYTDKMGGTSGACPVAAGVAALILSENPNLTNLEVRRILGQSSYDLGPSNWDAEYGFGRVDAYEAVKMALNPPQALTLFVDDDAQKDPWPGTPNYSDPQEDGSAEHPFDAIQEAIDNSFAGDTVIVLPGRYTGKGNIVFLTSKSSGPGYYELDLKSKSITIRSKNGPESCIIDCQNRRRGFCFYRADSVVEGFTITNGNAAGSNEFLFDTRGGGMYFEESNPTVNNCIFSGNSAEDGGGIYCTSESSPTLMNCIFSGNSTKSFFSFYAGGGIYIDRGSSLTLANCVFIENSTGGRGGGMYNLSGKVEMVNCIFRGNSARDGGGIYTSYGNLTLTNCILWGNTPTQIKGDTTILYSNIQGGWPGIGNINIDPCFADPNNGDYHLKSQAGRWDPKTQTWVQDDVTSPCIDAGNPGSSLENELLNLPDDPNNTKGSNLRINMGAYGGTVEASIAPHGYALLGDLNNDGIINMKDVALLIKYWLVAEREQPGDLNRDGIVNEKDLALLAKDWLKQTVWYINNKIN